MEPTVHAESTGTGKPDNRSSTARAAVTPSYAGVVSLVRAVGFDLDGTLFDHRRSAQDAVEVFLGTLGVQSSSNARTQWLAAEEVQFERWRSGRISFQEQRRERLRTVLPQVGMQAPTVEAELDKLFGRHLDAYRGSWRPFADSADVLADLRSQGLKIGLLTNGTQEQQLDKLRSIGLLDAFDVVCTSERIGAPKPDPNAFLTLADELGVAASSCLFVGDNPDHDIAGAAAVGMHALLVDRYGEHALDIASAITEKLAMAR